MGKLWNDIKTMLTAPFAGDLDLTHLFLIVGVVLVFSIVWVFILNHVRWAAQEVV